MTPPPRVAILVILAMQGSLLTFGIARDYRLKHEDNNALHATFARSHLYLGLQATRAQNYFYSPHAQTGVFYSNHPPGPGLVLAGVYWIAGADGPAITRATAIAFHLMSTVLFWGLARRLLDDDAHAALAAVVFVFLPESAFFGRMVNHEVLALPGALVLVRAYWELLHADRKLSWVLVAVGSCLWLGVTGWIGFFAIAACGLHAGWELTLRSNPRARQPFVMFMVVGGVVFAIDIAHLAWVRQGDLWSIADLFVSRTQGGRGGVASWLGRIVELHWRYFSLTSLVAMGWLASRGWRSLRGKRADPAAEFGLVFLIAGGAYVAVFSANAAQHDYWQFLLLPASALAIAQVVRSLADRASRGARQLVWRTLLVLVCLELTVTTGVTLAQRHLKTEAYCLETVEALRRDAL